MSTETELIAQDPVNRAIATLESNGNYKAKNPLSSASGKYEFTQSNFEGVKKNNPDLPNLSFEEFKNNPDAQELYQKALLNENTQSLKRHGLEVTPTNQYIMHWAGAPKGSALLQANDDDQLKHYLSDEVLRKNRLNPDTSVGEFRRTIDDKMTKALGNKVNPQTNQNVVGLNQNQIAAIPPEVIGQQRLDQIRKENNPQTNQNQVAVNQPEIIGQQRLDQMRKENNIIPAVNPASEMSPEHDVQLKAIDNGVTAVKSAPQTGEHNIVAADHLQQGVQEFGPRWGMAFAQALFGDKQGALNSITGGALSAPIVGEAKIQNDDGTERVQQIWINKNARGDMWYTDPKTGARLSNGIQVTSLSPEGAIRNTAARKQSEIDLNNSKPDDSVLESGYKINALNNITDRMRNVPSENSILNSITESTKLYGSALDNALNNPQAKAIIKGLALVKGGDQLEKEIQNIAILSGLPTDQIGGFKQYLRNIANLNEMDKNSEGKHAPGAGTAGILDLQGGARGVKHWLAERESGQQAQSVWNEIYGAKAKTMDHAQIIKEFQESPEFQGIQNYRKFYHAKVNGENPNLPDGAPIMNYKNGKLTLQKYNAKTGRVE